MRRELPAGERAKVFALLDAATSSDGRRPLSDHLYLDLVNGGGGGFAGMLVAENDEHGDLVAYGQLSGANEGRLFELVVDPDHEAELADIAADLLDAALGVIAADGGDRIVWWVSSPEPVHVQLAAEAGLHEHRRLHQMRRPLPAERPVTIETRPFRVGTDEEAWLRVNNRAFADHGEQGGWTLATLQARETEGWFDPDGFLIHERDGRLAGFCWTKIHPAAEGHEALGEIYVIAVDPDFHGLGLGSQLTLAGLEWLSARGITVGMLYVDAGNTTAVAMYERLGFHIHSTNVAFAADVVATPR